MKELDHLKSKSIIILDFLEKLSTDSTNMFDQMKQVVVQAHNKNNIKGLKMCYKDINEWIGHLEESQKKELDLLLNKSDNSRS